MFMTRCDWPVDVYFLDFNEQNEQVHPAVVSILTTSERGATEEQEQQLSNVLQLQVSLPKLQTKRC